MFMYTHVGYSECVAVRGPLASGDSLLPLCGSWGLNPSRQTWKQASLPAEPSHWPTLLSVSHVSWLLGSFAKKSPHPDENSEGFMFVSSTQHPPQQEPTALWASFPNSLQYLPTPSPFQRNAPAPDPQEDWTGCTGSLITGSGSWGHRNNSWPVTLGLWTSSNTCYPFVLQ